MRGLSPGVWHDGPMPASLRLVTCIALCLAGATPAAAHVEVTAPPATSGTRAVFTVGVPNERTDAATVRVALRVPSGFVNVEPLPTRGWTADASREGGATVLTWDGGRIAGAGRAEHRFRATAPPAGEYRVPATQTYDDGQVVRWIGPAGAEYPAPVLRIGSGGGSAPATPAHTIPPRAADHPETATREDDPSTTTTGTGAATGGEGATDDTTGEGPSGAMIAGGIAGVVLVAGGVIGAVVVRRRG